MLPISKVAPRVAGGKRKKMYINIAKLNEHGYVVHFETDGRGNPASVLIEGADPDHDNHKELTDKLKGLYPNVDSDTLTGIAYRALASAQAQDIIRISLLGR